MSTTRKFSCPGHSLKFSTLVTCVALVTSMLAPKSADAFAPPDQPAGHEASPHADNPVRVRVVVDAKALGDAAEFFEQEVASRVDGLVDGGGHEVVDSLDADVTVRVRLTFYNADDLDYEIDVDVSAGKEIIRLERQGCPQCVDEDLLAKVEEQREQILAGIDEALERAGGRTGESDGNGDAAKATVAPIGPLAVVGIVVMGLGLGVTIGGAVELGRGEVYDDVVPGAPYQLGNDHAPRGQTLLGAGIGGLVVGGALLTTGLVLRSKRRSSQREQAGVVVPMIAPTTVGLGWVGRF